MVIEYRDSDHTYTIDGRPVPPVTRVIANLHNPIPYPDGAAQQGTDIHNICHWDRIGTLDEENIDKFYIPYLDQWRKFWAENPLHIDVLSLKYEQVLGSVFGYAGRCDIIGDGIIMDLKTGAPEPTHIHQLQAYAWAAAEMYGLDAKKVIMVNLYLSPKGCKPKMRKWSNEVWADFMAALRVEKCKNYGGIAK